MNKVLNKDWTIKLDTLDLQKPVDTILFLGDIALAHGVADSINKFGYKFNLKNVYTEFMNKDLIVFNLECCLTERGNVWEPKPVLMNGKEQYLNIFPLKEHYSVNVANNHFLDLGVQGALDTIESIKGMGMDCFGAIDDDSEYLYSKVQLTCNTLSLIAYSPAAHPFKSKEKINVSEKTIDEMVKDIYLLKENNELLIVSLHQGVEFCRFTDRVSRKRAHALIDAGADSVICHHTHVIQGLEIYKGKVIFYGIGNFLIDIDTQKRPNTKFSLGLNFVLQDNKIIEIKVNPYFIDDKLQVQYLNGADKSKLLVEINWLSIFFINPVFSCINYLLARFFWIKLHLISSLSLINRVGTVKAFKYYFARLLVKIRSK